MVSPNRVKKRSPGPQNVILNPSKREMTKAENYIPSTSSIKEKPIMKYATKQKVPSDGQEQWPTEEQKLKVLIEKDTLGGEDTPDSPSGSPLEHWAEVDNQPIDFAVSFLPPQLLTLTDGEISANNAAFEKLKAKGDTIYSFNASDTPPEKLV